MKITSYIELYKMIELIANEGDTVKDFGINENTNELYIILESGKAFGFFPNV